MKPTRRQALALVPAIAIGTTVASEVPAKMIHLGPINKRPTCFDFDGLRDSQRFDNFQDLLVAVIKHAKKTGDKILEANEPHRRVFGWIAVPKDGGWPSDNCPINHRWEITQTKIAVTGNRMDPRFNAAIEKAVGKHPSICLMTQEKRSLFNSRMHLVEIPPDLAPCTPLPGLRC